MDKPKICVVIPALNEEEFIGKLIDSIKDNTYKNIEIIVVDDGSTDNTVKISELKGARVLINSPGKRGPSFGRNLGAEKTNAEIICFFSADFFIEEKDFFEKSVSVFEDNSVVSARVKYHTIQCTLLEKVVTREWGITFEPILMRRDFFLEVGGFPLIGFGEDRLLAEKVEQAILKKDFKQVVIRKTFFSGHGVHTLTEMYKQALWYGKTSVLFMKLVPKEHRFSQLISVYLRPFYFFSFIFSVLSVYFFPLIIFVFPFIFIFLKIVLKSVKTKNIFVLGKIFTFFVFGLGMIHGLFLFISGLDRKTGH